MTDQWICLGCQQTNAGEMHFCPNCGAVNPALAAPAATPDGEEPPPARGNRRLLWAVAIGLWVIGCAVLAIGGGIWWSRQSSVNEAVSVAEVEATSPVATTPPSTTATSTPTPSPTATPEPATPTPLPGTGETLPTATPTPTSEGVILFLSSRDHDPQTEAERRQLAQNRDVELYAMKPDGSGQTRLSDGNRDWWNGNASLTPYHISHQVVINGKYVFDLTIGQVVEELKLEFPNTESTIPFRAQSPMWSPDGKIFFFGSKWDERLSIYYLDNIQGEPQKLTSPPDDVWGDGWPVLSPDGDWILFYRNWYDEAQDGLWLMRPDGSEAHRIIAGKDGVPHRAFWSPDGSKLAFEGPKPDATTFSFEVWVAEAGGSNPWQLTSLPADTGAWEPKWSPDGERIVFHTSTGRKGQIFAIDVDGGKPQQLTAIGDQNIAPLWLSLSLDDILTSSASDTSSAASDTISRNSTPAPTGEPTAAAPPAARAASTCPPGVQITAPAPGSKFTRRYNYVIGTANIPRFHHWKLEYSTNPNEGWMYLFERDYPVENDKLMMLDASTVPRGPYGLRLTVVDKTGNYPEPCEVWYTNMY